MERGIPKDVNSIPPANFFPHFHLITPETFAVRGVAGRILLRHCHCYVINLPGSWLFVEIQNLSEYKVGILALVVLFNREPGSRLRFLVGDAVATTDSPYTARYFQPDIVRYIETLKIIKETIIYMKLRCIFSSNNLPKITLQEIN